MPGDTHWTSSLVLNNTEKLSRILNQNGRIEELPLGQTEKVAEVDR